jgi:hypothetical protein
LIELSPELQSALNYLFIAVVAWLGRAKADIIIVKQSVKKAHARIDSLAKKTDIDLTPVSGDENEEH